MQHVLPTDYASEVLVQLKQGLFLNCGTVEHPNAMTIGWGSIGTYWGQPMFVVPVRFSRYTHELIDTCNRFTVSVPLHDMYKELAYCGTRSGRDGNKFAALGLTAAPAQEVSPLPIIGECELHYECHVMYRQTMDSLLFHSSEILHNSYGQGDFHTMYYGKILACYRTDR